MLKTRASKLVLATGIGALAAGVGLNYVLRSRPKPRDNFGFKKHYTPEEFRQTPEYKELQNRGTIACGRMYDQIDKKTGRDDVAIGKAVRPNWLTTALPLLYSENSPLMCGAAEGVDFWAKELRTLVPNGQGGYVFAPEAKAKDFFFPENVKRSDWTLVAGFTGPDMQGHGGKWAYRDNYMVEIISQKCREMNDEQLLDYMQSNQIHQKGTRLLALVERSTPFYSTGTGGNILYHYTGIPEIRTAIKGLSSDPKDRQQIENNMIDIMLKSGKPQFQNHKIVKKMATAMYDRLQASACLNSNQLSHF